MSDIRYPKIKVRLTGHDGNALVEAVGRVLGKQRGWNDIPKYKSPFLKKD